MLGGFTSIPGAIAGCFLLGVIENLGGVYVAELHEGRHCFSSSSLLVLTAQATQASSAPSESQAGHELVEQSIVGRDHGTAALILLVLIAIALAAPYLAAELSYCSFSAWRSSTSIAVLGVNLVMGYAGQISLGHAGFAAIGAYTTALLDHRVRTCTFWLALHARSAFLAAAFGYAARASRALEARTALCRRW